jgi:RNA polymerase sigma-70 factor (ECF subfamily)
MSASQGKQGVSAHASSERGRAQLRPVEDLDFDELFRRFAPYVARIGYRLLGDRADVDDLVQDVFATAYRKRNQLRDPEAARPWLATSAVRRARRLLHKRTVRRLIGLGSPDYEDVAAPSLAEADRVLLASIYQILDRVPANQRIAWALRHLHGASLEEVARTCRCSLATAKRRIRAAHDQIRKELADG